MRGTFEPTPTHPVATGGPGPMGAAALAVLVWAVAMAGPVTAHGGADPWIHLPAQNINAGQEFELWGADLAPNAGINVELVREELAVQVGRVVTHDDGHFVGTLNLPSDVPDGYAELVATADDGETARMWVLVGTATGSGLPTAGGGNTLADPSVLVLGGLLLAGVVGLGYVVIRRATAGPTPARLPTPPGSRRQMKRRR
ncbi:hypothetical protein BH24CHL5_BH24CHL5_05150 [soil metagenome]